MVADAALAETVGAEDLFGAVDGAKFVDGDAFAVGHARAEAGGCGFIPGRQTEFAREGADVGFVQAGFAEWAANFQFGQCGEAGAVVGFVVEIRAVEHGIHSVGTGEFGDVGELDLFAVIAAVDRVGRDGLFEFRVVDEEVLDAGERGDLIGRREVVGRHHRTGHGDGDGSVTDGVTRGFTKEAAIHAS